jgi:transposase
VRHRRATFRGRAAGVDPSRWVFVDETGAHTALTRLYGRAPRGQRLVAAVPEAHWRTTTLVSAIRQGGVAAALVFEGATDEAAFLTFVREQLAPCLAPGDIVVLDNLAAHKVKGVARAIRKAGAGLWYLPPYSPDLNPIEKVWAKVKAHLRKADGYPATIECNAL